MIMVLLAYVGGMLTILSPCILPVLPFLFARVGPRGPLPFHRHALPLLGGMAVAFGAVGFLAMVPGGWVVRTHEGARLGALALMALFGFAMLFPSLARWALQPLVGLGSRLSRGAESTGSRGRGIAASAVQGVAVGLLWAPCAGPILGLVFTGAALQGASGQTALLLLAYGLGAATSLALPLFAGGRVMAAVGHSGQTMGWLRRGLGVGVLAGVGAISLGLDRGPLTRFSLANTTPIEAELLAQFPAARPTAGQIRPGAALPVLGLMPPLKGGVAWLHSPPLGPAQLNGKVVLVNIWTYSCINCLRTLPYVKAWEKKYRDHGLVVIGVHSPEFAFERNIDNVRKESRRLGVTYPLLIDNNFTIWKAFQNNYWPAFYFSDAQGRIRRMHFGEGEYAASERAIQQLLADAGARNVPTGLVKR